MGMKNPKYQSGLWKQSKHKFFSLVAPSVSSHVCAKFFRKTQNKWTTFMKIVESTRVISWQADSVHVHRWTSLHFVPWSQRRRKKCNLKKKLLFKVKSVCLTPTDIHNFYCHSSYGVIRRVACMIVNFFLKCKVHNLFLRFLAVISTIFSKLRWRYDHRLKSECCLHCYVFSLFYFCPVNNIGFTQCTRWLFKGNCLLKTYCQVAQLSSSSFLFVGMWRICVSSKIKHPGGSGAFVL